MTRRWSLQLLLPALVLLFLLAAVAVSVVGALVERRNALLEEARADSLRKAALLVELAEQALETQPQLLANAVSRMATDPRVSVAAVIDAHGYVAYSTNRVWSRQAATQLPGFSRDQFERAQQSRAAVLERDTDGRRQLTMMSYAVPAAASELRGLKRGVVYLAYDLSSAFAEARTVAWRERLPELGVLLLVAALLGVLVQHLVAMPMRRMQGAAETIAAGDFAQRLPQGGPREINGLARAFEHMRVRLADLVERLASDSRRTQAILDNAVDGIITIDRRGTILSFNRAAEHIFGYAADEVIGHNVKLLMPEPDHSRHDRYLADYLRSGEARIIGIGREAMAQRKNGELFPIDLGISEIINGDDRLFIGRVSDISLRKQTEAALRESEARFQHAMRGANDGLWDWHIQEGALYFSPRWKSMLGYDETELLNAFETWESLVHPDDLLPARAHIQACLEGARPQYEAEFRMRHKDGHWVHILSRGQLERDADGQPLRMTGTHVDLTERMRAEEQIRRLNAELEQRVRERTAQLEAANQELEAFSYSVSHDLRAPLRAVDGFSQALLEDYGAQLDAAGRSYLDRVRAGAQRMGTLIDDILKLSRVARAPLQRVEVNVTAMVQGVVARLHELDPERHVTIEVADGLRCRADTGLLRIALENLLGNAWKYTAKTPDARIVVTARCEGEDTIFHVSDNGVGFDMKFADKLFGAFQRLHRGEEFEGNGIGLATVARILRRHGGHIWAESMPGQGATFFFTLEGKDATPS